MTDSTTHPPKRWETNADAFRAIGRQGIDLYLGALVYCSVQKNAGNGTPKSGPTAPKGAAIAAPFDVKVSARTFAKRAGTTDTRISRHYKALDIMASTTAPDGWDIAENGPWAGPYVRPADEVTPDMTSADDLFLTDDMDAVQAVFAVVYDAKAAGSRPRSPVSELTKALTTKPGYADKLVAEMSDEAFEVLQEAIINATVDAPTEPIITPAGVTPAPAPSPAKTAAVAKAADKVREAAVRKTLAKSATTPVAKPAADPSTDGAAVGGAIGAIKTVMADDELMDLDYVVGYLQKVGTAISKRTIPLTDLDREYLAETMAKIETEFDNLRTLVGAADAMTDEALDKFISGS